MPLLCTETLGFTFFDHTGLSNRIDKKGRIVRMDSLLTLMILLSPPSFWLVPRNCPYNGGQGALHEHPTSNSAKASKGMWLPLTVFFLLIGFLNPLAHAGDTDRGYRAYSYPKIKESLQKLVETADSEKLKESSQILLDRLTYLYEPELSIGERGGPDILPSAFIDLDPSNLQRAFQLYCADLEREYREGHNIELLSREYETCRKYDMGKKGLPPDTLAVLSMVEDDEQVSTNFLESVKSLPQDSAYQATRFQCLNDHQGCRNAGQLSLICSGFLAACLVSDN